MKQQSLSEIITNNPYPGRGIVLGLTPDGKRAALAYFIMGRSAGSRSRAFVKKGMTSASTCWTAARSPTPA
jgi:hypothetical protein